MLQNRCKGMIFYPNNQKKRHKKHKSATFFYLYWVWITEMVSAIGHTTNDCSLCCIILFFADDFTMYVSIFAGGNKGAKYPYHLRDGILLLK